MKTYKRVNKQEVKQLSLKKLKEGLKTSSYDIEYLTEQILDADSFYPTFKADPINNFPIKEFSMDCVLDMISDVGEDVFKEISNRLYWQKRSIVEGNYDISKFNFIQYNKAIHKLELVIEEEIEEDNKSDIYHIHKEMIFGTFISDGIFFIETTHFDSFRFVDANHLRNTLIKKGISSSELDLDCLEMILNTSDDCGKAFHHLSKIVFENDFMPMHKFINICLDEKEMKRMSDNFYIATTYKKPILNKKDKI